MHRMRRDRVRWINVVQPLPAILVYESVACRLVDSCYLGCFTCTQCIDAAYCYRCCVAKMGTSMAHTGLSVCVSLSLLVTTMRFANGWTVRILFGMWSWVGPRNYLNHVLDGSSDLPSGMGSLRGYLHAHCRVEQISSDSAVMRPCTISTMVTCF